MKKIPYYPGCTLKTTGKNFEDSAIATAKVLGLKLLEIDRWNCCGTVTSLTQDDLIHHIASVRNFIRVQEMNERGEVDDHRLLTLCSMCYNTLKSVGNVMQEWPDDLDKINNFMDREEDYKGGVTVVHLLELIREMGFDEIKSKVKKDLGKLKVSPYYGCTLLRPKEVALDDPEVPTIMEDLLNAIGVDVIDSPKKSMCCGSYQTVRNPKTVVRLAYEIIESARKRGAEALVTSCPLCAFNLDDRQKEIKMEHPDFERMPVFYFTQLTALAFGLKKDVNNFDLNFSDPRPLLKKKKI